MKTIPVEAGAKPYRVDVGRGLTEDLGRFDHLAEILKGRRIALISDRTVHGLHGKIFEEKLEEVGARLACRSLMEPGEAHKNLVTLSAIWDDLVDAGLERGDLIVALGGGVVGDVAGFAAATYLRGIDFMQVPTTLLAMVDSSVGGKTAIDHPRGKNLIGAFHQPSAVVADLALLNTLPRREALSGLAEVIKAAILADTELFDLLEEKGPEIIGDHGALEEAVARAIAVKADVVARDEREGGPRALLNLGHTYGHAVEAALGFGGPTHGEAVAMGLVFATRLSHRLGKIAEPVAERIEALVDSWGYPQWAPGLDAEKIKAAFSFDKKCSGGVPRWVLPLEIGQAQWGQPVDQETVDSLLIEMQER